MRKPFHSALFLSRKKEIMATVLELGDKALLCAIEPHGVEL